MSALDFPLFVGKYVRGTTEQQSLLLMRPLIIPFVSCYRVVQSGINSTNVIIFYPFSSSHTLTVKDHFIYLFIVDLYCNLSLSLHRLLCLCGACTLWWPCFWVVSLEVSSCWVQFCPSCCCLLLGTAGSQIASSLLGSPCLWCVHQLSLYLAYLCVSDGLRLPVFDTFMITM